MHNNLIGGKQSCFYLKQDRPSFKGVDATTQYVAVYVQCTFHSLWGGGAKFEELTLCVYYMHLRKDGKKDRNDRLRKKNMFLCCLRQDFQHIRSHNHRECYYKDHSSARFEEIKDHLRLMFYGLMRLLLLSQTICILEVLR